MAQPINNEQLTDVLSELQFPAGRGQLIEKANEKGYRELASFFEAIPSEAMLLNEKDVRDRVAEAGPSEDIAA